MRPRRRLARVVLAIAAGLPAVLPASEPVTYTTEKWRRTVIDLGTADVTGNPFAAVVDVRFEHVGSGHSLTLPAYFAGDGRWKAGFLPERAGDWKYRVRSDVVGLDGLTGTITVAESDRMGRLEPDPREPRKWRLADGPPVLPIALRMEFALLPESGGPGACDADCWDATVSYVRAEVGALLLDTRLQDEFDTDMNVFEGPPEEHRFDLAFWDRLERRMDALADRGGGAYLMFYADDAGKPQWPGQSATEHLLIRYAVARLSGYPRIVWDLGIDIAEYRTAQDVRWFGETLAALDPFDHPLSSRIGGGSGVLFMRNRTYESLGDRRARMADMTYYFSIAKRPIMMSDSFAENRPDTPAKSFTPGDVRRAAWKGLMSGGLGIFLRGSDGYFYPDTLADDLESEQWLRHVNPFLSDRLGDRFPEMTPCNDRAAGGYCLSTPGEDLVLLWTPGASDTDDPAGGRLARFSPASEATYTATLFDPRTATDTGITLSRTTGGELEVEWPDDDDWLAVLHIAP